MRIAPNLSQMVLSALQTANQSEQSALLQLTTGRRVNRASDDPAAAATEVGLNTQSDSVDQFLRSISSITSELQTSDSTLSSAATVLQRAITLGVQGASDTLSQQDRSSIGDAIQAISQQMLSVANASFNGKFLFAGTVAGTAPYMADPSSPSGVTYQGNNSTNQVEIEAGQSVTVNQPGSKLFSVPGADVFQALNDLATQLKSGVGTSDTIGAAVNEVRSAYNQLNSARMFYGNTIDQLSTTQTFMQADKLQLTQRVSDVVGVDLSQAATSLANAENARDATLQAAAKVGSLTLLDYLFGGSGG